MTTATSLVPLHPESGGDDATVRWVMPAGTLGFVGRPARLPEALSRLVEEGLLSDLVVEPSAVVATLGPGRRWRIEGARFRDLLQDALARPEAWQPPAGASPDDVLRAAAAEVVDSAVGDYIRSHGGEITVLQASDGVVEVRLAGACAHCPLVDRTLATGVESALRTRFPELRKVVAHLE